MGKLDAVSVFDNDIWIGKSILIIGHLKIGWGGIVKRHNFLKIVLVLSVWKLFAQL